jgi:RNA polymerase sigma-70 factor, ECF subfamily
VESAPDDGVLLRRARDGHEPSLNQLLVNHYDRVYAICRRMTGNDADALDAAQDALIAIVRGLDRFDGRASFTTWAYRVTTNACLDQLRRDRRRPVSPLDPEAPRRDSPDLDQDVADRVSIDQALARLPTDFRAPVVLRDVIGLDYAEIAEVLDIPPGTVRSRIARGRRALAGHLGETGVAPRPSSSTADDPTPASGNPTASPNVGADTP